MEIKRNKLNEYIIQQFLDGDLPGYSSKLNGEFVWALENNPLYGSILKLRNDMGYTIIHTNDKKASELSQLVQETYYNLDNILASEKQITEYLTRPENADLRR